MAEGYLYQNNSLKDQKPGSWEKAWYVLQENSLCYYKKKDAKHCKGIVELIGASDIKGCPQFSTKKRFVFSLLTRLKRFYFYTTSDLLRNTWINALEAKIIKLREPQRPAPSVPVETPKNQTPGVFTPLISPTNTTSNATQASARSISPTNESVPTPPASGTGSAFLFQVIALYDCDDDRNIVLSERVKAFLIQVFSNDVNRENVAYRSFVHVPTNLIVVRGALPPATSSSATIL
jgi:hypothetical protein